MNLKRIFDLFVSLSSFPFLFLVSIPILILIRLDSKGTVFFKQKRVGKNGKIVFVYKFRTMIQGTDRNGSFVLKSEKDPRVTKVGRVLRRTHLDEIPQILNILKGEMSLVGPRIEPYESHNLFSKKIKNWDKRLIVLPGLAGLAQNMGACSKKPQEKLKYDLEYIRDMSLWFDFKLIIQAVKKSLGI